MHWARTAEEEHEERKGRGERNVIVGGEAKGLRLQLDEEVDGGEDGSDGDLEDGAALDDDHHACLLYTSPSPRDRG